MRILRAPRWAWWALVVTLFTVVAWQASIVRSDRLHDSDRRQAVSIATAQVLDLTTLDSDTVDDKIRSMSARASGDFKDELTDLSDQFVKGIQDKQVVASGSIDAAGAVGSSDDAVIVLVASTAAVAEGSAPPTSRTYRIRVQLARVTGTWKINAMEFVQ